MFLSIYFPKCVIYAFILSLVIDKKKANVISF